MKNEEISQKPTVQSHSTGEAYANLARSAWEKPAGGAFAKSESFAPPTSGSDMGGPITSKSGAADSVGKPGGGGADSKHEQGTPAGSSEGNQAGSRHKGPEAHGSSAQHENTGAADKNTPKADGVGAFGKAAPSDKGSLPSEKHIKSGGEGSHSLKPVEKKDKQDAALNFLPNLSIA